MPAIKLIVLLQPYLERNCPRTTSCHDLAHLLCLPFPLDIAPSPSPLSLYRLPVLTSFRFSFIPACINLPHQIENYKNKNKRFISNPMHFKASTLNRFSANSERALWYELLECQNVLNEFRKRLARYTTTVTHLSRTYNANCTAICGGGQNRYKKYCFVIVVLVDMHGPISVTSEEEFKRH